MILGQKWNLIIELKKEKERSCLVHLKREKITFFKKRKYLSSCQVGPFSHIIYTSITCLGTFFNYFSNFLFKKVFLFYPLLWTFFSFSVVVHGSKYHRSLSYHKKTLIQINKIWFDNYLVLTVVFSICINYCFKRFSHIFWKKHQCQNYCSNAFLNMVRTYWIWENKCKLKEQRTKDKIVIKRWRYWTQLTYTDKK